MQNSSDRKMSLNDFINIIGQNRFNDCKKLIENPDSVSSYSSDVLLSSELLRFFNSASSPDTELLMDIPNNCPNELELNEILNTAESLDDMCEELSDYHSIIDTSQPIFIPDDHWDNIPLDFVDEDMVIEDLGVDISTNDKKSNGIDVTTAIECGSVIDTTNITIPT